MPGGKSITINRGIKRSVFEANKVMAKYVTGKEQLDLFGSVVQPLNYRIAEALFRVNYTNWIIYCTRIWINNDRKL